MKRFWLGALLLGFGFIALSAYAFLRDTHRGGAPSTVFDVKLPAGKHEQVFNKIRTFAGDRNFRAAENHAEDKQTPWYLVYFDLKCWDAEIEVKGVPKVEKFTGDGGRDFDNEHFIVWVHDSGWLWYSSEAGVDRLADSFAATIKSVDGVKVKSTRIRF